ncbi:hypothetical protein SO802_004550 [Lithocarpus litseifolius]|uniref:F-box domain-containing protein n=1 Tax=Lithocarpus litseifolius TaxID=425828 RepID=A0AAW2E8Z8_9ROSI
MKKSEEKPLAKSGVESSEENFRRRGWRQRRDNFGRFPTRQRLVSSELVMISDAGQRLLRIVKLRSFGTGYVRQRSSGDDARQWSVAMEMKPRRRGLVESEEQGENKKMKSIVVEEQEEGSESRSGTGFVDLDRDSLYNVFKRLDAVSLGRAECVNKQCRMVAQDWRLWEPFATMFWTSRGGYVSVDAFRNVIRMTGFPRIVYTKIILRMMKHLPLDFYSIDPRVFSRQIKPWV